MKKQSVFFGLVFLMVILFGTGVCQCSNVPSSQYHYQDLGSDGLACALADRPASSFQAAGYLENQRMPTACLFNESVLQATAIVDDASVAYGINMKGQAVGFYEPNSGTSGHAFLWTQDHGLQDLGTFGYDCSYAYHINDKGQIAGELAPLDYQSSQAFLWSQKQGLQVLGTLGGNYGVALDVNNKGQVTGYSTTRDGACHPFLWSKKTGMVDLGTLGGDAEGNAINNLGEVVGDYYNSAGQHHAFLWTKKNGMEDLGTLGCDCCQSVALNINKYGQVVGYSYGGCWTTGHAFLWTRTEGMKDLNDPAIVVDMPEGVTLICALAINSHGLIVGMATVNGVNHAFLLTPIDDGQLLR